ncbi:hypothetical protein, partial [Burkholderia gladioli]|uniref:hypothetical protein n=1 Tax=Burkholderia gladioli TaxID=28095 RepID=UPI001ABAC861
PSRTANRCKTIDRFSRNSPPDSPCLNVARTPLLTLARRNFALAVLDSYSSLDGKPSTGRTFKDANMEDMFFLRSSPANYPSTVGARMICDGVKEKPPL